MSWMRVAVGLLGHPKTGRLARLLGDKRTHAVGVLVGLWDYAHQYHIDGQIDPQDWPESAELVGYADHAHLLAALRESGFVERKGDADWYHDWDEYQGVEILRRQANRERMRAARAGKADPVLNTLPPRAQIVQGQVRTYGRTNKLRAREESGPTRAGSRRHPRARPDPDSPTSLPDPDRETTAPKPITETMADLRRQLGPALPPTNPTNGTDPHAPPA